jgi:hypothetical protein
VGLEKWMSIALPAHPLEKSAFRFKNINIHRLPSANVWVWWWESGLVVGIFGGDVIHLKQVRFGYGYSEERIMGSIGQ